MCGIVGVLSRGNSPLLIDHLKSMCDVIAHRGPDDAGYFVAQTGENHPKKQTYFERFTDKKFQYISPMLPAIDSRHGQQALHAYHWNLFLGHRRLAIIDVSSAGHQPMSNLSQTIWVVFNGEIYNYLELKQELIQLGYEFGTNSDTEVIINAYQEWGIECIKKFNGMFAFALWDKVQHQFYLARDRYGIKPLYYTQLPNGKLVFASEVKAILEYPDYEKGIDHEALVEYFTFQNIFTDKTLYKSISLLPSGHYVHVNLNNQNEKITPIMYWDYHFHEPSEVKSEKEYCAELDWLFKRAVQRQLVSDVEVGSYLSGGMDSGSITAIAAQTLPYLKTFTVGFDLNNCEGMELSFDEREKAEYLSYKYKTEHYEMVLKSGDMERCMSQFAWHLEEPRIGQSYPNFYASKLASKFVKVVLSGAGGDELFGGYPWRYYRAVNNDNFEDYIGKYYQFWQRLLSKEETLAVFSPISEDIKHINPQDIFRNVFKTHANEMTTPEDYVHHSLYFEAKTFLHGLLVVEDKLSMSHSLETRVPFLDNDLVEFSMKLPVHLKLGKLQEVIRLNENEIGSKKQKHFEKTNDGKLILRKALDKYITSEFSQATKQGFSSPDNSWFKGDSIEFVKRTLLNSNANIYQFMDKNHIQKLLLEHLDGKRNRRLLVWSLLNFEQWCHHYG